jgi:hypothetical protein
MPWIRYQDYYNGKFTERWIVMTSQKVWKLQWHDQNSPIINESKPAEQVHSFISSSPRPSRRPCPLLSQDRRHRATPRHCRHRRLGPLSFFLYGASARDKKGRGPISLIFPSFFNYLGFDPNKSSDEIRWFLSSTVFRVMTSVVATMRSLLQASISLEGGQFVAFIYMVRGASGSPLWGRGLRVIDLIVDGILQAT